MKSNEISENTRSFDDLAITLTHSNRCTEWPTTHKSFGKEFYAKNTSDVVVLRTFGAESGELEILNFDGIHLGHKNLIDNLISESKKINNTSSLLITFNPHTKNIVSKNLKDKYLLMRDYSN